MLLTGLFNGVALLATLNFGVCHGGNVGSWKDRCPDFLLEPIFRDIMFLA